MAGVTGWLSGWRTKAREEPPAPLPRSPVPDWALGSAGVTGEPPRNYEAQVRAGYLRNPVAQRAVRLVAEAVAALPVRAADAAMLALVPAELLEAMVSALLLHGNTFVLPVRDAAGGAVALHALRPERLSVKVDKRGWPAGWRYATARSVTDYAADALVHVKAFHPLDDQYGLGALGAASGAIALLNQADAWNRALIANKARPSGALVYEPGDGGVMSEAQFKRLQDEIASAFTGAANAGRPMLLEGGLKWQALGLTPAEMDFRAAREAAAREVALAFGVPPVLLGLPGDGTYSNYREANVALYRQSVLPMADRLLGALGRAVGARFTVDLNAIPALWADREALWRQIDGLTCLTGDEKRQLLGFGPAEEAL